MIFDFPDPSDWLTITRFDMFTGQEPQVERASVPDGASARVEASAALTSKQPSCPVVSLADRRQTP